MSTARIKAVVVFLLMVCSAIVAHAWRPTVHLADSRPKVELETIFPKAFGDWAVDDRIPMQLISPDMQAQLDRVYNQTLSRTYVNRDGDHIMLSVAYGGDQSDATRAHRPEVCYPAQGFAILSSSEAVLQVADRPLPVRHLVARAAQRNEPISYWIVVGDRIALTGTQQKLAQLSYGVHGVISDGMLVRVSSIDLDANRAYRLQENFIAQMAAAIRPQFRSQVIGAGGSASS